jgi:hypothetical protein
MRKPRISVMKLRSPTPMPIADPVLMCRTGARLEPPPEPKGSASKTRAPFPQSLPREQVLLDEKEDVVVLVASSRKFCEVALGTRLSVSSWMELACWTRAVDSEVSLEDVEDVEDVVGVGRVADARLESVEVGCCVRRGLASVEDITIKMINMLVK